MTTTIFALLEEYIVYQILSLNVFQCHCEGFLFMYDAIKRGLCTLQIHTFMYSSKEK